MFFNKINKSNSMEELVPKYKRLLEVASQADDSVDYLEVGFFVASVVTIAILHKEKQNADGLANKFNIQWLSMLHKFSLEKGNEVDVDFLIKRFQGRYPLYRDLFINLLKHVKENKGDNKANDWAMEFTLGVFAGFIKEQEITDPSQVFNLMTVAPFVLETTLDIYNSGNNK